MEYNKSHEVERYRRLCLYYGFNIYTYKKSKKFLESGFIIIIIIFLPCNANTCINITNTIFNTVNTINTIYLISEIKVIVHFVSRFLSLLLEQNITSSKS